jgi:hypothetical protein
MKLNKTEEEIYDIMNNMFSKFEALSGGYTYYVPKHDIIDFLRKLDIEPKIEGICDKCGSDEFIVREDDKVEAINHRLEVYLLNQEKLMEAQLKIWNKK